jgi:formylglycine-generating enzyme required for sulfatase activity
MGIRAWLPATSLYANHPAVAINWWSAYAFARFEGKRLPTSLEWEAAARGTDGRLFPWGDEMDISAVNCADSWSDHPLITCEVWREELDRGRLADARPGPVDEHLLNVSPFGVREMAGNVWEFTGTVLEDLNEAVICGGSFDNPYRAVQTSSKGTYLPPAGRQQRSRVPLRGGSRMTPSDNRPPRPAPDHLADSAEPTRALYVIRLDLPDVEALY